MRNNRINNPEQVIEELKQEIDRLVKENIELKLEIQLNNNAARKAHNLIQQLEEKDRLMDDSMESLKKSKKEYDELIRENKAINEEIKEIRLRIGEASDELYSMMENIKQFYN